MVNMSEKHTRSDVADWRYSGNPGEWKNRRYGTSWSHWSHWSQPNRWRTRNDKCTHVYNVCIEYGEGAACHEKPAQSDDAK